MPRARSRLLYPGGVAASTSSIPLPSSSAATSGHAPPAPGVSTSPAPSPSLAVLERLLDRLAAFLSPLFVSLILVLLALYPLLYLRYIRPLLPPALHPTHAFFSLYLLIATPCHYLLTLLTDPGAPAGCTSPSVPSSATAVLDAEAALLPSSPSSSSSSSSSSSAFSSSTPFFPPPPPPPPPGSYVTSAQTWRWCKTCGCAKPPRAHHDSATNRCALVMDHYCPAAGGVIGLHNYHHFLRFLLHALTASVFFFLTALHLSRRVSPHASAAAAASQHLPAEGPDVLFFAAAASLALAVALSVLVGFHVYLVATGQTTIEFYENWAAKRAGLIQAAPFHRGLRANFVDAFGSPPLPWLLPAVAAVVLPEARLRRVPPWMIRPDAHSAPAAAALGGSGVAEVEDAMLD